MCGWAAIATGNESGLDRIMGFGREGIGAIDSVDGGLR